MNSLLTYNEFLHSKLIQLTPSGFEPTFMPSQAFDFQKDIIRWSTRKGKSAIFAMTGLGKSLMQLSVGKNIADYTENKHPILILAPLGVTSQTVREGQKFNISVNRVSEQNEVKPGLNITNYEKLHKFDCSSFIGIILDESSVMKDFTSKTANELIENFRYTPYKLSCTATPSPNDYVELGTQAEFLGVMTRSEMLSMFFINDTGKTGNWRLKKHAEQAFWKWVCSWACFISSPSDLGYQESGFDLPKLNIYEHVIEVECKTALFAGATKMTMQERTQAKRDSIDERIAKCAELVNNSPDTWITWCKLNPEGDGLEKALKDSVQIAGKDSPEFKEKTMLDFADNKIKVLVTKADLTGKGLNWQNCYNMAFVGLGDSFQDYFQAIRRCYRFGQTQEVNVHIITSSAEGAIVDNVKRKEKDFNYMMKQIAQYTQEYVRENLATQTINEKVEYKTDMFIAPSNQYKIMLGDTVERIKEIPDNSIDFVCTSLPFRRLFVYSNSERDMGNCRSNDEFDQHFTFLVKEMLRVMKPGRLAAIHCMNLQRLKSRDGDMGIEDFRGDIIRMFLGNEQAEMYRAMVNLEYRANVARKENDINRVNNLLHAMTIIKRDLREHPGSKGFIHHSEIVIWKDPVVAMERTKSTKLKYQIVQSNTLLSAQGIPDYVLVFGKPGDPETKVTKTPEDFPLSIWRRYASPVWFDINQTNTLQKESAREEKDEAHIAPLQLDLIQRLIELWTNKSELVFDPFLGIGSTVYQALKMKRKGIGCELKQSYYKQAVLNCQRAEIEANTGTLFDLFGDDQGETFGVVDSEIEDIGQLETEYSELENDSAESQGFITQPEIIESPRQENNWTIESPVIETKTRKPRTTKKEIETKPSLFDQNKNDNQTDELPY